MPMCLFPEAFDLIDHGVEGLLVQLRRDAA